MTLLDRLLGRPPVRAAKAVTALGPWDTGIPLSLWTQEPQQKAARTLQAYKVGWFYKAGKKIAEDVASLDWSVSSGDMEQGESETTLDRPDLRAPLASLSPIEQFMQLLEAPVRDPATGRVLVTGRQLMRKTEVRLDFAGAAAWYLEGGQMPTSIYGISPTRLWPSVDRSGRLIGWVLDKNSPSGGTATFDVDEILWFSTGNAEDNDLWGQSVVEAVYSQVPLTDLMARHTSDTLALGGRLSGMLWPKDRALSEDEFVDAQRAWRNVASDPNAARRMLIFPEPMEWAQGAATPEQIGIPDLATLNRDEILTAFPISPYRLGVPTPGGLNSGEVRREDRKDYWEETIHPRADLIEETIQVGFLSRYEDAMGATFDFDIIEPDMDDAPTIIEKVGAYKGLVAVGFDPKESIAAVGLSSIKWLGPPAPPTPPPAQDTPLTTTVGESLHGESVTTQQVINKATKARDYVANIGKPLMTDFFHQQRDRVVTDLRRTLPTSKAARMEAVKSDPEWWDTERENAELRIALRQLYDQAARTGLQVVADSLDRVVLKPSVRRVTDDLLAYGGTRITDINDRTFDAIKSALTEGTRRGYSVPQLIDGVPTEGFTGIFNVGLDNGVGVWDDARAEMIARTETALSYNRAALDGYKEFNVNQVQAIDGDGDPECAERDGEIFDVEDALLIEDHPNGTLDWVPVVDKSTDREWYELATKAIDALAQKPEIHVHNAIAPPGVHVDSPQITVEPALVTVEPAAVQVDVHVPEQHLPEVHVAAPEITVNVPDQPTPEIHVAAPVVNLSPADVTVNVPKQVPPSVTVKASPVVVNTPSEMRITALPDRVTSRKVKRDNTNLITETVEVETDG